MGLIGHNKRFLHLTAGVLGSTHDADDNIRELYPKSQQVTCRVLYEDFGLGPSLGVL